MNKVNYAEAYLRLNKRPHTTLEQLIITASVELGEVSTVIDAGCGPGLYFPLLEERFAGKNANIIAVDVQRDMVDAALRKINNEKLDNIEIVKERLENINTYIEKGTVDLILCASVFQFMDLPAAVRTISEIISDRGILIFSIPMGMTGIVEEGQEGIYKIFQEELKTTLIKNILVEMPNYPIENVMKPLPKRTFKKFSDALEAVGFEINRHYIIPNSITVSQLRDYFRVPWRAEKLLPGIQPEVAVRCIGNAIDETVKNISMPYDFPFVRDFHYATAIKQGTYEQLYREHLKRLKTKKKAIEEMAQKRRLFTVINGGKR